MSTVDEHRYKYLDPRPGSNYRQLWVKGRRIRAIVIDGYIHGPEPYTPEELARELQIPIEAVHEALGYVVRHRDFVQADCDMETADIRARGLDRPHGS
ncbi:MAG TPA: hypothetical protein VG406_01555 [Isosphaeraceae bacterium]|jgi:hypothetical protein|nr:hypothetical protein [Isosphaeraceae bacterium]